MQRTAVYMKWHHKKNEGLLYELKIKPMIRLYLKLLEDM
jgi:hypothetical protein